MKVPFIDLSLQHDPIREELNAAIERVTRSNQFYGDEVTAFEDEWAEYCGAKYCVACSSGTSALELALRACRIGVGSGVPDEVIVPANSFIATAEAVTAVGATVKFADVDLWTHNLSPNTATVAGVRTPRTRAVIPVHLYGRPAPMAEINKAVGPVWMIEDAAQAHGAFYKGVGNRLGSGRYASLTCFSFYPTKNLGAFGDAGAVTTNSIWKTEFMRQYLDHGRTVHHEHMMAGHNHRMDAIQAAVLRVKLQYLDGWNDQRRDLARNYNRLLANIDAVLPPELSEDYAFYLYVIRADHRDALQHYLAKRDIGTGLHYPTPLHKTTPYATDESFPNAEQLAKEILSLPLYPGLAPSQVEYVCYKIKEFYDVGR